MQITLGMRMLVKAVNKNKKFPFPPPLSQKKKDSKRKKKRSLRNGGRSEAWIPRMCRWAAARRPESEDVSRPSTRRSAWRT